MLIATTTYTRTKVLGAYKQSLSIAKVKSLPSTSLMELLIKELEWIVSLVSTALVVKDVFTAIVFRSQFLVGQYLVSLTDVLEHGLSLVLILFGYFVRMPLKTTMSAR